MKKNLDITKPRYNEQNNFASPLALRACRGSTTNNSGQSFFVSCWRRNRQFYVIGATHGKGSTFTA